MKSNIRNQKAEKRIQDSGFGIQNLMAILPTSAMCLILFGSVALWLLEYYGIF